MDSGIVEADLELWIRRFRPALDTPVRLICFPHAGGSATYFAPLAKAFPAAIDVVSVQYPGRQDRRTEPGLESIGELADAALDAVRSCADRPVALLGHSMGALVAFEVAGRLEKDGVPVDALFASGRRAPSTYRDELGLFTDDNSLIDELRKLRGTDPELLEDPEIQRMILPALRSDYRAVGTYRWTAGIPLAAPIHVHVGQGDPRVSAAEAHAWSTHTSGEFTVSTYPGGHFYLNTQVAEVARAVSAQLNL
ncbi:MAG: alpha/beta fold hydrolase [Actinoplanes sp.]